LTDNNRPITDNNRYITNNVYLNNHDNLINTINNKHICNKCNKEFTRKWGLKKHIECCKGIVDKYSCEYCNKKFKYTTTKYKHYKICKVKKEIDSKALITTDSISQDNQSHNNVSQQIANTINNTTIENQNIQNNITVFAFPDIDSNFEFNCEKITNSRMKKIIKRVQEPQFKFNNFVGDMMDNPQNRIIKKSNPNTSYSLIHVGNDEWDYGLDKDVYKIFTHHATVAALDKIREVKKDVELVKELYHNLRSFEKYVKDVNEMDYESSEYAEILQRIKLIVINLSKRW
jgi:hypothetical protein